MIFNDSIKIIDCFIFYNEIEMLKYRLNILNEIVDYFIIVEATHTHTGKEKQLFYNDNKYLFEKYKEKIIHIVVDDFPKKYPNINIQNNEQWQNENFHRNCISRGINKLKYKIRLKEEDVIIISDLDEIPDPNTLLKIKNNEIIVETQSLEMDFYYYNLNTKLNEKWYSSKIISYKNFKELNICCEYIRNPERYFDKSWKIIEKGGWHLSYFGDVNFIKNKLEVFAHQEYNNNKFNNHNKIEEKIKNSDDLFDRKHLMQKIQISDNHYLPPQYETYLTNFFEIVNSREKIFYSQCCEDKFLYENYFKNKRNGVYIELGALDGNLYSNTKFFEDYLDWTGILIEPNPAQFKSLKINRPNNFLFNNLVSNEKDELRFRYFVNYHAAVSGVENTLSKENMDVYFESNNDFHRSLPQNTINMKPTTLTEIVKGTNISYIDLLSLDVEGHEYEVLQSWDFSIPIYLILIETLGQQPEKDELCRQYLIKNGYRFHTKCSHNEIYILDKV